MPRLMLLGSGGGGLEVEEAVRGIAAVLAETLEGGRWGEKGLDVGMVTDPVEKGQNEELRRFVLSSDEVDRYGDIVEADGWRLENYLKNPVVLWAHDYRMAPIGRTAEVWGDGHRLLGRIEFAGTEFARGVEDLYAGGFLRAVSVGFRPLRWELLRNGEGRATGVRYIDQELLEVSAVPVPANPEALGGEKGMGDVAGLRGLVRQYLMLEGLGG